MELNREQIIKALECCSADTSDCHNCPYSEFQEENCFDNAKKDALSLINSQEQMIKELTEENERLRAEGEWISVADRLPEPYTTVLVYGMGSIASDYLTSRGVWYNHEIITHWKLLPEPPKESEDEK